VFPVNSLILSDIVERLGHEPLTMMGEIRRSGAGKAERTSTRGLYEPRKGLKYVPVEVPSGVRGRLALIGRLVEEADAAVIMGDADFGFGCGGCARTNEVVPYMVAQQGIPCLTVARPTNLEEAKVMVRKIRDFLKGLEESQ
jgi:putative methanogenesis marker protein 5